MAPIPQGSLARKSSVGGGGRVFLSLGSWATNTHYRLRKICSGTQVTHQMSLGIPLFIFMVNDKRSKCVMIRLWWYGIWISNGWVRSMTKHKPQNHWRCYSHFMYNGGRWCISFASPILATVKEPALRLSNFYPLSFFQERRPTGILEELCPEIN